MVFKHKDLTINLAQPSEQIEAQTCSGCPPGGSRFQPTPPGILGCKVNSVQNGLQVDFTIRFGTPGNQVNTVSWGTPEESLSALSTLKGHLQQHLAEIEKQETELTNRLSPQTVEDVDTLSDHLTDALASLKARRDELVKGGAAAPKAAKKASSVARKKK